MEIDDNAVLAEDAIKAAINDYKKKRLASQAALAASQSAGGAQATASA